MLDIISRFDRPLTLISVFNIFYFTLNILGANPYPTISASGGIYVSGIHTHIKFQHVIVTRGKGISSIRGGLLEMERCHIYGCKSSGLICRSGGTAELVQCELHDNQGSGVVSGESGTAVRERERERERENFFYNLHTCIFFFPPHINALLFLLCCLLFFSLLLCWCG